MPVFFFSGEFVDVTDRRLGLLDDQLTYLSQKASSIQGDFSDVMSQCVLLKDDYLKLSADHAALGVTVMLGEDKYVQLSADHAELDSRVNGIAGANFGDTGCSKF